MAKRPSRGANVDALDGVRGLAVLLVIASHSHAFGMSGHGAVGVWLFFVLSAFLLTMPFAGDPAGALRPARLAEYASRRLRRIVPAYYLLLLVWYLATDLGTTALVDHLLFRRGDVHLWSIPQELIFYLVLPFLALLHRLVFRRLAVSAAAMAALAVLASYGLGADVLSIEANGRPQRLFAGVFLCGVAASFAWAQPDWARWSTRPASRWGLQLLGLAALGFFVATAPGIQRHVAEWLPVWGRLPAPMGWYYPGTFGIAAAVLVYAAVAVDGGPIRALFSSLPLRALGIVSYGLYLYHVGVIAILRGSGMETGVGLFVVALVLSVAVAQISYAFVERPLMKGRVRR